MRSPAILSMIVAGVVMAACSSPQVPGDQFNVSVHNPTPAAQDRTAPAREPGDDLYNRVVPLP
ncbi:hypothetical protein [Inquilinus limosus]|uniref:hypothetical protein n=1 Tax=Inquilinus limosus TaxID=171674 RepID=UPI001198212D|nr:hypothetical protein [Inquilinus limosus]